MWNIAISLICLLIIILLAIYWTLWKIRAELNQNMEKVATELAAISKSIEKKADNR